LAYPGQLATTSDYITYARVVLQDQVAPFRYPDADLLEGLNLAFSEARRLRPDLFLGVATLPSYTTNDTTPVVIDSQYPMALIYYMVASAEMKDEEWTQDARAVQFMAEFKRMLTGV
jgi:hypothetical protein